MSRKKSSSVKGHPDPGSRTRWTTLGRAVAKPLADVHQLWNRIEKALKANSKVKEVVEKGCNGSAEIAACEAELSNTFPPDLRSRYLIHDGQKAEAEGLFPEGFAELDCEFVLLPLDEVIKEWNTWNRLHNAGEFKKQTALPDAGIRSDWWNAKWVPFASDGGGDSFCIDLAPAEGGVSGQVILHHTTLPAIGRRKAPKLTCSASPACRTSGRAKGSPGMSRHDWARHKHR